MTTPYQPPAPGRPEEQRETAQADPNGDRTAAGSSYGDWRPDPRGHVGGAPTATDDARGDNVDEQSVAGEEDPGAAEDVMPDAGARPPKRPEDT